MIYSVKIYDDISFIKNKKIKKKIIQKMLEKTFLSEGPNYSVVVVVKDTFDNENKTK